MYGEMKEAMVTVELSANSLATSAMRRMFSVRSCSEKPRSLLRPKRTLSPAGELEEEEGGGRKEGRYRRGGRR